MTERSLEIGMNAPGSSARRRAGRGLLHAATSDPLRHPTPEQRAQRGRAGRTSAPRSSHGEFAVTSTRPDPVELLIGQAATRVPELVPIRHGRMVASPFAFFRGAAAVMAADLAPPRSGLGAQLCGDAHLSNFGGVRLARARDGLRRQRLRRDPARARSSGTSSAWPPASRSPPASRGFDDGRAGGPSWPRRSAPTAGPCGSSPGCVTSTSGTRTSTAPPWLPGGATRPAAN